MAKNLILQNLTKLARGIGASHNKWTGTRTNINFLGKGPTKNPLFQGPLQGLESVSEARLGSRESIIGAVEDAMGYASAGKLNGIQLRALELNLESLNKIYNPPPLPMASITDMAPGIEGLRRFPKETHKFMGRPLKDADFAKIDQLVKEGKLPSPVDTMPLTRNAPLTAEELAKLRNVKPTRIPENIPPASAMMEEMGVDLPQKTAAARATMLKLLDVPPTAEGAGMTLRETMSKQDLKWLLEGGGGAEGDPIAIFAKYFGPLSARQIPSSGTPEVIEEFAKQVIRRKDTFGRRIDDPFFNPEDIPFAHGGLAHVLQVPRSSYSKGKLAKNVLSILNRNKKNAEYMFKASDNVSPGYTKGDMKYNAELLAEQLADDAGVVYDDLADLDRIKFYGTAYDYLAKEMGMMRQMKNILMENRQAAKDYTQLETLKGFDVKGRKPSASGGLAKILEV